MDEYAGIAGERLSQMFQQSINISSGNQEGICGKLVLGMAWGAGL